MNDAQFAAWLSDPTSIKVVLVEATAQVSGVETVRYMATGAYVTGPSDTPANTVYLPVASAGISFTERIPLSSEASLSAGDVEIDNYDGAYDSWLNDVWVNRPIQSFIGDPSWPRADFRMIFNGVVADIDSKSREKLNLKLRDKLQRLNTPVSDTVLGGSTANATSVIPITLGECHNVTPLLTNPVTREYQVHGGAIEGIIEVRDNGKPVTVTPHIDTGKFTTAAQPFGTLTVSVQGSKQGGTYSNTISALVQRLVTSYGKSSDQLTSGDLDASNLAAFESAHPQPVGLYLNNRENLLTACQMLAASVHAQLVMSRTGLLRLIQITSPPSGTPTVITDAQIVARSLHISERTEVVASVKLGYCKNWTVQENLLTTIPEEHKALFAQEWLTRTATDATTKTAYKLDAEPVQEDTMLLVGTDASTEATRRLNLLKVPRNVYQFEGTPELLTLELGQAVTLTSARFGLSGGALGTVVALTPNWKTGHITVEVLV